tara:strand:- start:653 stop:925 length:273 start_codon:yes stop_codon:yes gene_type:complete
MNKNQKIVLIIGIIVLVIQLWGFTPYFILVEGRIYNFTYGNYFNPPTIQFGYVDDTSEVFLKLDVARFFFNWVLTAGFTFIMFLVLKDKK